MKKVDKNLYGAWWVKGTVSPDIGLYLRFWKINVAHSDMMWPTINKPSRRRFQR